MVKQKSIAGPFSLSLPGGVTEILASRIYTSQPHEPSGIHGAFRASRFFLLMADDSSDFSGHLELPEKFFRVNGCSVLFQTKWNQNVLNFFFQLEFPFSRKLQNI